MTKKKTKSARSYVYDLFLLLADLTIREPEIRRPLREALRSVPGPSGPLLFAFTEALEFMLVEMAKKSRGPGRPRLSEEARLNRSDLVRVERRLLLLHREVITEAVKDRQYLSVLKGEPGGEGFAWAAAGYVKQRDRREEYGSKADPPILWAARGVLRGDGRPDSKEAGEAFLKRLRKIAPQ